MKNPPFQRPHKRAVELERQIAERDRSIARLEGEIVGMRAALRASDSAIDAALVETHATTDPIVAEYVIALEHAVERHLTVERERDEARAMCATLSKQIEAFLILPPPKPAGYEHLTHDAIEAIRATTMTHADRQNVTQDEVFERMATDQGLTPKQTMAFKRIHHEHAIRAIVDQIVESDPPPAKDDAQ